MDEKLQKKSVVAAGAMGARVVITGVVQVLSLLVLSKFLSPRDFGVSSIAITAMTYFSTFGDLGLNIGIVRSREKIDDLAPLALTLQMIVCYGLFSLYWMFIFVFSFDADNAVIESINLATFVLLILPFRGIWIALLERDLKYGRVSFAESSQAIVAGVISCLAAYFGAKHLSIVIGQLSGFVACALILSLFRPSKISFSLNIAEHKAFLKLGGAFQLQMLLNLSKELWRPIVIGGILGAEALGYVDWAKKLIQQIVSIGYQVGRIIVPTMSRLQNGSSMRDQGEKLEVWTPSQMLSQYILFSSMIFFSVVSIILAYSQEIISIFFGPKWLPAEYLIIMFCSDLINVAISLPLYQALVSVMSARVAVKISVIFLISEWVISVIALKFLGVLGAGVSSIIIGVFFPVLYIYQLKISAGWTINPYRLIWKYLLVSIFVGISWRIFHNEAGDLFGLFVGCFGVFLVNSTLVMLVDSKIREIFKVIFANILKSLYFQRG
ncbi:oligosaccharide flippase family protein [Oleisolibacter albus]|uniref:oligosaccharide flippase family protein n=1 Tax=Oleisolibacter albus TaxID=2171757 RepID=UPI001390318C|nr:oligosaccharide flippase family protein [Oleisolibacter albus]